MGKAGVTGRGGGMVADGNERQFEQMVAFEMRCEAAQRIGAGDDDRAVTPVHIIAEVDRFEPQHRRLQYLETPRAQRSGGRLVVRMRTGDENSHTSTSRRRAFCSNGRLHFKTSQSYPESTQTPLLPLAARAHIG